MRKLKERRDDIDEAARIKEQRWSIKRRKEESASATEEHSKIEKDISRSNYKKKKKETEEL